MKRPDSHGNRRDCYDDYTYQNDSLPGTVGTFTCVGNNTLEYFYRTILTEFRSGCVMHFDELSVVFLRMFRNRASS